jgi:hypothetical protein
MVPLFVKAPHQSLAVVDSIPSRTIDLLPTLADHLGLELTWEHDGRSLLEIGREAAPLIVQGRSGNAVTLTDVEEGVAQSSTYLHSLLGDGQQSLNLYSLGVFDSVLNTNTESIPFGSSTLTASVDEIWRVAHVSPKTGLFVPGFIHGQLSGDVESESGVGIALNGRVLSVVPVFDVDADGAKFSAIIPDEAFHTGFNQLEVFEVSGSPGSPILEAIDLPGNVEFTMERARSGRVTRLVGSDGTTWPIEEESPISGNVDEAAWFVTQIAGGEIKDLVLNGWAIEDERIRPAESVVFFVDGTFAGSTLLDLERPDIEDSYADEDALMSGFVGRLSDLNSAPGIEIQAFALSDGVAEELTITDEVQADIAAG